MSETGEFRGVIGTFNEELAVRAAIDQAKAAGLTRMDLQAPLGDHAAVGKALGPDSPVKFTAMAGGLTGIITAVFITVWMSSNYPLIVGGKPIVSWPPFLVVCFELFVLLGSLGALLGALFFGRLLHLTPDDHYDPRAIVDRFALFFPCAEESDERRTADRVLREAGAADVRAVHARRYSSLAETRVE